MEIEPGDILVCTVDKIVGTVVFVDIEGTDKKGTIIFSEVAARLETQGSSENFALCSSAQVLEDVSCNP